MPIDGFFEWRATKPPKQPYAIAMRDYAPFCVAAIWDEGPALNGGTRRTFAVITCPANELVGQIHNRMPVIIAAADYDRWLSGIEPDPRDLLRPYPSELMRMWRISTRVNRPANNDPSILDPENDLFPAD
jgi:putative SOS response-associated peptidase YedK